MSIEIRTILADSGIRYRLRSNGPRRDRLRTAVRVARTYGETWNGIASVVGLSSTTVRRLAS